VRALMRKCQNMLHTWGPKFQGGGRESKRREPRGYFIEYGTCEIVLTGGRNWIEGGDGKRKEKGWIPYISHEDNSSRKWSCKGLTSYGEEVGTSKIQTRVCLREGETGY